MPKGRSSIVGRSYSGETRAERRVKTKKKREDLFCFLNELVEPLGKSY